MGSILRTSQIERIAGLQPIYSIVQRLSLLSESMHLLRAYANSLLNLMLQGRPLRWQQPVFLIDFHLHFSISIMEIVRTYGFRKIRRQTAPVQQSIYASVYNCNQIHPDRARIQLNEDNIITPTIRSILRERQFNSGVGYYYQMDKQLHRLYMSLPYILLKKKYLIPPPPKRLYFPVYFYKSNPYGMLQKHFPQVIDSHVQEMFMAGKNAQLQAIFTRQFQKKSKQILEAVEQYVKEYITPFKTIAKGIQPEMIYLRENMDKITDIMLKEGDKYRFRILYREFRKLPEEERQNYRQKAEEVIKAQTRVFSEQAAKYMVPTRTYIFPNVLYLRDNVIRPITRSMMGLYKQLPEDLKQQYRQRAAQLKKNDKKNLQQFLAKRNLSLNEYKVIKKVCTQYDYALSKRKKDRKAMKGKQVLQIADVQDKQHIIKQQFTKNPDKL